MPASAFTTATQAPRFQEGAIASTNSLNKVSAFAERLRPTIRTGQVSELLMQRAIFFGFITMSSGVAGDDTTPCSFKYKLCESPDMSADSQIGTDVALSKMIRRLPVPYIAADAGVTDGTGVPCEWHYDTDGTTPLICVLGEIPDVNSCAAVTTAMDGGTA